ncbi:hypothetical protein SAMN05443247_08214 [Bradyrhizobium erythrophlei]|jgi:hypothetical protein|nr:hypothetical protein SAMN05443247_08214 [Bradyrhizobium erythrophlei]
MQTKSLPSTLWIIPAILLVIAVWRLPYGYYTFVRIVVCGSAAFIALVSFKEHAPTYVWPTLLLAIATLFNPLIPIFLDRTTWFYLDLSAATAFLVHLFIVRQQST